MHGVIGRALSCFAQDSYGAAAWARAAAASGAPAEGYLSVRRYDAAEVRAAVDALAADLGTSRDDLLSDVGVYLVAHPRAEALRRLMRFAGADFDAFVHALEDLPARGRLALPGLELPAIRVDLRVPGPGRRLYAVECRSDHVGTGHLLLGVLRAMADDYGALAMISYDGAEPAPEGGALERLTIEVLIESYAAGRAFDLVGTAA